MEIIRILILIPRATKSIKTECRIVVARSWGVWESKNSELMFNGYRVSVWEDEKVLDMNGGDCCLTI
jgi:hypothetical protein